MNINNTQQLNLKTKFNKNTKTDGEKKIETKKRSFFLFFNFELTANSILICITNSNVSLFNLI